MDPSKEDLLRSITKSENDLARLHASIYKQREKARNLRLSISNPEKHTSFTPHQTKLQMDLLLKKTQSKINKYLMKQKKKTTFQYLHIVMFVVMNIVLLMIAVYFLFYKCG